MVHWLLERWRIALVALLAAAATWQAAAALLASPAWIGSYLTHDDTYLALQVARGWSERGFPTFDGLHRTNGFQPLWGLLLLGLAQLFDDPIRLLRSVLLTAAALNTLTGVLLARLGLRIQPQSPLLALLCCALWCAYSVSGKPALCALENALLPLECAAGVLLLLRVRERPGSLKAWLALALLCAAVVWTRLDAAVLVAFAVLLAGWPAVRTRRLAGPLAALIVLLAAGGGYVAFERWAGGTNTPVSGLVKRTLARRIEPQWSAGLGLQAVRDAGNSVLKHATIGLGLMHPRAVSAAVRLGLVGLLVFALAARCTPAVRWVGLAAMALFLHALLIRVWLSGYFHDALWYYSATNALAPIGVGLLLTEVFRTPRTRAGLLSLALTILATRLAASTWMLQLPPPAGALAPVRQAAAAWLRQHLPAGQRAAAWNAGELAFFSGVPLLNLDGLVNDAAFHRDIVQAQGSLEEYLRREGVTCVVDYARDAGGDGHYWHTLSAEEWDVAVLIGEAPAAQQLIVKRKASPGAGVVRRSEW